MLLNLTNIDTQMRELADNAVTAAKDKFGVRLDYSENSLLQLELLLQQAHEAYKKTSSIGNSPNISIENTVRIWGSYYGEVIRQSMGGDWVSDQKNVFLLIGSQKIDPLGQVRGRVVEGPLYNIQPFFLGLKSGIQNNQKEQMNNPISDKNNVYPSIAEKPKNRTATYFAVIFGTLIFVGIGILGVWILLRQGKIIIPAIYNPISQYPNQINTIVPPVTPSPTLSLELNYAIKMKDVLSMIENYQNGAENKWQLLLNTSVGPNNIIPPIPNATYGQVLDTLYQSLDYPSVYNWNTSRNQDVFAKIYDASQEIVDSVFEMKVVLGGIEVLPKMSIPHARVDSCLEYTTNYQHLLVRVLQGIIPTAMDFSNLQENDCNNFDSSIQIIKTFIDEQTQSP
jgi:hypothetical protein